MFAGKEPYHAMHRTSWQGVQLLSVSCVCRKRQWTGQGTRDTDAQRLLRQQRKAVSHFLPRPNNAPPKSPHSACPRAPIRASRPLGAIFVEPRTSAPTPTPQLPHHTRFNTHTQQSKHPVLPAQPVCTCRQKINMARGNQREKAREKNLKEQAGKVCELSVGAHPTTTHGVKMIWMLMGVQKSGNQVCLSAGEALGVL
jgi:hypothetical protein